MQTSSLNSILFVLLEISVPLLAGFVEVFVYVYLFGLDMTEGVEMKLILAKVTI